MWSRAKVALFVMLVVLASQAANAKTLRWSGKGDVTSMDPYAFYTTVNSEFLGHLYESLVRLDRSLKFEPALATSWERIEPTLWRFHLRRDVKFHNGNPFSADDVVASLKRASDPNSPYLTATSQIQDVKKVDDLTVDVILKGKYPLILNDLAGVGIMNKAWMEQNNTLQPVNPAKGEESYATVNANGTGPFMLKSRRPDAETVLIANPAWWDKATHNIDEVVFRPIALDATRTAALLSGELDLITPAPLQDIDRIKSNPNLEAVIGQQVRVLMWGFNQAAPELKSSNIKGRNPFADIRVREALYRALDNNTLSQRIMRGMSKLTASVVAPQIQGYDPSLAETMAPYDLEAARKLLAEAGYPNGFEVSMDCSTDEFVNAEQLCQATAAMWARIGVKVNLTALPASQYNRKLLAGECDLYIIGWANTPQLNAFSILNNVMRKGGRWNPGGYSNARIDELVQKIATEVDDNERQKMLVEALMLQKRDFAYIPMHQEPLVWAVRKGFQVHQAPDNKVRLWLSKLN
jgi:peptide/nickel transport system substrate-binding protein